MRVQRIPEPTISVARLALWWDVTAKSVRRWIEQGDLEAIKQGRQWFVTIRSANDFQERRRVRA